MKFNTAALTLLTVASQAAAIDSSANYPRAIFDKGVGFSGTQGQPGYVAKRAAEAVAEAIAHRTGGVITFCGVQGETCQQKREARVSGGGIGFCGTPGSGCQGKRAYVDKIYNAAHKAFNSIEAREAAAEADAIAEAIAAPHRTGGVITFCGVQGETCQQKRSEHELGRRMAAPDAHRKGGVITFCGVQGETCQQRRNAEPVAAPEAHRKGGVITFCGVQGETCQQKRTDEEKLEALAQIKRSLPNIERDECYAEGGPCTQIEDAKLALEEVKRSLVDSGEQSAVAKAHQKARSEGAYEAELAEREAEAADGANTLARRALQDLEDAIDEGVAALNDPKL